MPNTGPHIGTLREKPLHASLKIWYQQDGDLIEEPVDGFVIDLVRDDLLIEIQTRGFSSMKMKLIRLLELGHRVRLVHPIARDRWILKVEEATGEVTRRLSPKHGKVTDVFGELVSFPELMTSQQLEIELVFTNEEEVRTHKPGQSWRRRGWVTEERRLIEVLDTQLISDPFDLLELVPRDLPVPFTTGDLSRAIGCPIRTAQQMAYCLRRTGVLTAVGKRRNSITYRKARAT